VPVASSKGETVEYNTALLPTILARCVSAITESIVKIGTAYIRVEVSAEPMECSLIDMPGRTLNQTIVKLLHYFADIDGTNLQYPNAISLAVPWMLAY